MPGRHHLFHRDNEPPERRIIRDGDTFTFDEDFGGLIEREVPPPAEWPESQRGEPWGEWAGHEDDLSTEVLRFRRGEFPPRYREGDDNEPR